MARSKPQTTFTITYGGVNQNTAPDSLTPVFIAPRYEIHAAEYDNATFADATGNTVYSGAAMSGAYPQQTAGALLDSASVSAYILNPAVKLGDSTGAAFSGTVETSGGAIVFTSAVAGQNSFLQGGYNLQRGDKLVSGTTVYNVTSVAQETTQAAATITSTTGVGGWAANYTGTVPAVYVLTAISSATAAGTATMLATAVNGDLSYQNQQVSFGSHGSAVIGNLGLVVSRVSGSTGSGASLIINCAPGGAGIYNSVFVDSALPSGAVPGLKVQTTNFIVGSALISPADVTVGTSEATIAADANCVYGSQTYPIASGNVELDYRELLTEDTNELQTASMQGIEDWVGPLVPENPLGMAYNAAIQTGYNSFYLCAAADATDAAINEAMTAAAKIEDVYSLVPLIQTPGTIAAMQALIAKYSDKKVAQVKRGWIFSQLQKEAALLTAVGTISGTSISGLDADALKDAGIAIGDNAIVTTYDATLGKTTKTVMAIAGISGSTITLAAPASISGQRVISFSRTATPSDLAKAVAAEAAQYNNPRINYVYAEPNTVAGYAFENAQYIVPVLATMRGSMPPHAPLTDVAIPGVSISTSVGFSEADLDTMNNGGVWVCFRDNRGEMVSRHAITTGGVGTIAEEDSAVSNGDNILRTVRNQVSWLRGNCNVTPALIDKIYVNVQAAFNRILARNYSDLIGPQILEVKSLTVRQDPNNTAGVIGVFDLDLPDVYLNGDFSFNLF